MGYKYEEVAKIYADRDVSVNEQSDHQGMGVFSIGSHRNWLYSHSLWETPEALEKVIYNLLKFSLNGIE